MAIDGRGPRVHRWIIVTAFLLPVACTSAPEGATPTSHYSTRVSPGAGGSFVITSPSPSPAKPVAHIVVQINASAIAGEPGATPVVATFRRYYSAINSKQYVRAYAILGPSLQAAAPFPIWLSAVSTTHDSKISLLRLSPGADGTVQVEVTFTSHQAAGKGPRSDPGETCTHWHVLYTLARTGYSAQAPFRIDKGRLLGAGHEPCGTQQAASNSPRYPAVDDNPWDFNFVCCQPIYQSATPAEFCAYFPCEGDFFRGRGYIVECEDGSYGHAGGIQGSCSHHGGNRRALLKP